MIATALLASAATLPDSITFAIAAAIVIGGALAVVFMKNPVHSALSLVMTLFGMAVLFIEQDAQFLAAVQIIVYAGAIVVLFLFVIMLLGVDKSERISVENSTAQRVGAVVLGIAVLVEVILLGSGHWVTGAKSQAGSLAGSSNVTVLGKSIFTTYLLPFEVTSALLIVAVVAAVVLARRHDGHEIVEVEIGARESIELARRREADQAEAR